MAKNILNTSERNGLFGLLVVGAVGGVIGAMSSDRFWFSFLQNSLFMLTIALGAVLFVAFHHFDSIVFSKEPRGSFSVERCVLLL